MKTYLVRGVPLKMQQDGWWLSPPPPPDTGDRRVLRKAWPMSLALLVALIALADLLFWDRAAGLSLAVFGGTCFAVALALWPRRISPRTRALSVGLAVLSLLPLVELVQPLSLLFFFAGLPLAVAALAGRRLRGPFRYWWRAPVFTAHSAVIAAPRTLPAEGAAAGLRRALFGWSLPLGTAIVFAGLLLSANPVLEGWVKQVPRVSVTVPEPARVLLWLGIALLVWPLLRLPEFAPKLSPDPKAGRPRDPWQIWLINAPAITRSLVLFNAMFALQNGMDLAVIAGGVALPEGMTYAEYAHRGAYPLVALALLSGAFALLARPFTAGAPVLRNLLLIWVAQTVWLTCSSMLRLDLYVDVYGLTRLRVAAAIWMGLVLLGLVLILWQIGRGRSNGWLLVRVGAMSVAVLYLCSFVNIDGLIARHNLSHDVQLDQDYLCRLSEGAAPAIAAVEDLSCWEWYAAPNMGVFVPHDWREWGFRNARVRRSLAQLQAQKQAP